MNISIFCYLEQCIDCKPQKQHIIKGLTNLRWYGTVKLIFKCGDWSVRTHNSTAALADRSRSTTCSIPFKTRPLLVIQFTITESYLSGFDTYVTEHLVTTFIHPIAFKAACQRAVEVCAVNFWKNADVCQTAHRQLHCWMIGVCNVLCVMLVNPSRTQVCVGVCVREKENTKEGESVCSCPE